MGFAAVFSLQQDLDLSISHKHSQMLQLNNPIRNLYQPKTIESTFLCNSLKWCDEDDNLENLFEECCKLEEELVITNTRILEKDENEVKELYRISQSKIFSQTSICMYKRRNVFQSNNKFTDKVPNSILKRNVQKMIKYFQERFKVKQHCRKW